MPSGLPAKSGLGPLNGTYVGSLTLPLPAGGAMVGAATGALGCVLGVHAPATIAAPEITRNCLRLVMRNPPRVRIGRGAAEGAKDCVAIVHAILALARGLGVETTAEGVETENQAKVMRQLGCTQLQGFHFGRPVRAEELGPDPLAARRRIA